MDSYKYVILIGLYYLLLNSLSANIKSTTGEIKFNINSTDQMKLNSTGLGVHTTSPEAKLHVSGNAVINNQLHIGGSGSSSNLSLNGTKSYSFISYSSNAVIGSHSLVFADTSSDNITLTLPYAGNVTGQIFTIKKSNHENSLYLLGGGNLIDLDYLLNLEESSYNLPQISVLSNGENWFIMNKSDNFRVTASESLIGHWPLDETPTQAGLAQDFSINSNHASINGVSNERLGVNGIIEKAIELDGNLDYVEIGDPSELEGDNMSQFTISLWVFMNDDNADNDILAKGVHGPNEPFVLWRDEANTDRYAILITDTDGDYSGVNYSSTAASLNTWTHLAISFDADNEIRIYIDGIEDSSSPFSEPTIGNIASNSDIWRIGHDGSGSNSDFHGKVDDLRIFNRVLSASEITSLYQLRP